MNVLPCPLRPLQDRVILIADSAETEINGLILPEMAKEQPGVGWVAAVGPGKVTETAGLVPVGCAVGDKVIYAKYSGTKITIEGAEYVCLRETDLVAVLEGKNEFRFKPELIPTSL